MAGGDGILGNRGIEGNRKSSMSNPRKWVKSRERWLVVLGVILHAVYMLSIFDIYFKTPIVHGMDPVKPRFHAPAKRLVLLVGLSSHTTSLLYCLTESQMFFCCFFGVDIFLVLECEVGCGVFVICQLQKS